MKRRFKSLGYRISALWYLLTKRKFFFAAYNDIDWKRRLRAGGVCIDNIDKLNYSDKLFIKTIIITINETYPQFFDNQKDDF